MRRRAAHLGEQLVEERSPNGYTTVTDVTSRQELEDIAANYKRVAVVQVEAINANHLAQMG
jgi:hypothetical protein